MALKNIHLALFLLVFSITLGYSQSYSTDLIPYQKGDKWGYMDKSKKTVITPQYDWAELFVGGLAKVGVGEFLTATYGAINRQGDTIIPLENHRLEILPEVPLIRVERDKKWGFYNFKGKLVIPIVYSSARNFSEGLTAVCKDGCGFLNLAGDTVIPFNDSISYEGFMNGVAVARRFDKSARDNRVEGYINKEGEIITPLIYEDAEPFYGGFGRVNKTSGFCAYVNKKGDTITPFIYTHNSLWFNEGVCCVRERGGSFYFIDTLGNKLNLLRSWESQMENVSMKDSSFLSKEILQFPGFYGVFCREGLIPFVKMKPMDMLSSVTPGKHGFMNKTGEVVIPPKYGYASPFFNGLSAAVLDSKLRYIDKNDSVHIQTDYIFGAPFYCDSRAMVLIDSSGTIGFIDRQGNLFHQDTLRVNIATRPDGEFGKSDFPINDQCLDIMMVPYVDGTGENQGYIDINGTEYFRRE